MPKAALLDDLLLEAESLYCISLVAIAKQLHAETGAPSGEFPCPRCHTGTVRWCVSPVNGHARVLCTTQYTADDGQSYRCTAANE
jgi:hypothetical protein